MAGGAFGGGNGSKTNPYLVEDIADLDMIRTYPDKSFKLSTNINAGVAPYNTALGWTPINNFKGVLDGNGKKIYNLYINRPAENNVGLFGSVVLGNHHESVNMCIMNLVLENANIIGNNCAGAIIGNLEYYSDYDLVEGYEFLSNVAVSGNIVGNKYTGGLIGKVNFLCATGRKLSHALMKNCFTSATIAPQEGGDYVGQLVGIISFINQAAENYTTLYLRNCVGIASLRPEGNIPPAYIGDMTYGANILYEKCYVDGSKWLSPANDRHRGLAILTTADMKNISKISSLSESVDDNNIPYWSLEDGRYPELYCNCNDYLYVYADGQYYTYDNTNNEWISHGQSEPTIKEAISSGMRRLENVPPKAWDLFKTKNNPSIVNIMDKASNEEMKYIASIITKESSIDSTDKTIFRKKINFNEDSGVLSAINI